MLVITTSPAVLKSLDKTTFLATLKWLAKTTSPDALRSLDSTVLFAILNVSVKAKLDPEVDWTSPHSKILPLLGTFNAYPALPIVDGII